MRDSSVVIYPTQIIKWEGFRQEEKLPMPADAPFPKLAQEHADKKEKKSDDIANKVVRFCFSIF